jgi:hypothetical protein
MTANEAKAIATEAQQRNHERACQAYIAREAARAKRVADQAAKVPRFLTAILRRVGEEAQLGYTILRNQGWADLLPETQTTLLERLKDLGYTATFEDNLDLHHATRWVREHCYDGPILVVQW